MLRNVIYLIQLIKYLFLNIQLNLSGKLNLNNIYINSEVFFNHLLNILYDLQYENKNISSSNEDAIDLKDINTKSVIQVTNKVSP